MGKESKTLKSWMKKNSLLVITVIGVLLGIIIGSSLRRINLDQDYVRLIAYPGELFMRLLKLIILPLIVSSLVIGSASLNARLNGKIAIRTFTFFVTTSTSNACFGTILATILQPGNPDIHKLLTVNASIEKQSSALDNLFDLGRNIITDNIFQATFQQAYTSINNGTIKVFNLENNTFDNVETLVHEVKYRSGINTLGLVFFSLIFGTILGTIGEKGKVVTDFFSAIFEVIMKMVTGVMWLTPLGVCSIIIGKVLSVTDLSLIVSQLAWFITTAILGVFLYQLIILQLLYLIFVRKNPFKFYASLAQGTLTAFATASTAAALPSTFKIMDEKLKIDKRITKFILPIGCNINMDGTALFISIATVFIAQMNGIILDVGDLITVIFTTTAASFSTSSVPSAALVLLLMVLSSVNLPSKDVTLLFAVDWIVDRFRTTNNMLSDCYCAAIVEKLSAKELQEVEPKNSLIMTDSIKKTDLEEV